MTYFACAGTIRPGGKGSGTPAGPLPTRLFGTEEGRTIIRAFVALHERRRGARCLARKCPLELRPSRGLRVRALSPYAPGRGALSLCAPSLRGDGLGGRPEVSLPSGPPGFWLSPQGLLGLPASHDPVLLAGSGGGPGADGRGSGEQRVPQALTDSDVGGGVFKDPPRFALSASCCRA